MNAPTRDAFKLSAPTARTYKADPKFGLMRLERLKELPRRFRSCERRRTPSKHLLDFSVSIEGPSGKRHASHGERYPRPGVVTEPTHILDFHATRAGANRA
jgi:hypothetical protein